MKQFLISFVASPDDCSTRSHIQDARNDANGEAFEALSFGDLHDSIEDSLVLSLLGRKRGLSLNATTSTSGAKQEGEKGAIEFRQPRASNSVQSRSGGKNMARTF